jgi:hypothetical protein
MTLCLAAPGLQPRAVHRFERCWAALCLLIALIMPGTASAQDLTGRLRSEADRTRATLLALPSSPLVDGERSRVQAMLDDVDALLRAGRIRIAIETLSSTVPGTAGFARASTGWDDTGQGSGKHIDALTKEWEGIGPNLQSERARFPSSLPKGQSAFIRAMAEQSLGQVDEHYAVAVDYARVSGVSAGAYYLGRAEGHMAWALTLSRLNSSSLRPVVAIPTLSTPLARLEDEIVSAYAKPGSTAQHANFILANSSLKLAKELEQHGRRFGALVAMLRSLLALCLATTGQPTAAEAKALTAEADGFAAHFAASKSDESIGEAFLEKARIALEKSEAGGEAGDRERVRAAGLLRGVLPRYVEIMEGLSK